MPCRYRTSPELAHCFDAGWDSSSTLNLPLRTAEQAVSIRGARLAVRLTPLVSRCRCAKKS